MEAITDKTQSGTIQITDHPQLAFRRVITSPNPSSAYSHYWGDLLPVGPKWIGVYNQNQITPTYDSQVEAAWATVVSNLCSNPEAEIGNDTTFLITEATDPKASNKPLQKATTHKIAGKLPPGYSQIDETQVVSAG